jgi:predicted ATPase
MKDIDSYRVYHFHDTSDTAGVKGTADVEDHRVLSPQAENLAAFLYWMQQKKPDHFANIEDTVRQIAPFFDEFRLEPSRLNESKIRLAWKEKGSDAYFNASSLSDGTLRFICLSTLLLQPDLPSMLLLDEPELGLHPAAVALLADLLTSAATRTQVIVATQSVTLVNHFSPDSVWTVNREDHQSVFKHLASADMTAWLDDYALGELWEKNVLGARP